MITTVSDNERAQDAELEALRQEVTAWSVTVANLEAERDTLKAKLAALEVLYLNSLADATQWQLYKSRKDAVIAAGMGKKVMRDSAAGAAPDLWL